MDAETMSAYLRLTHMCPSRRERLGLSLLSGLCRPARLLSEIALRQKADAVFTSIV